MSLPDWLKGYESLWKIERKPSENIIPKRNSWEDRLKERKKEIKEEFTKYKRDWRKFKEDP